ncbi:hypothetical protein NEMBOFW57_010280 [Staphylotrichum longicolle]|uniref:FAD-binding PCMH-type domain-containing protein n=1 Tax=Staphylotrichum longicolle TaxID=669026 RepID=A0AAD4HU87_9PEZI|nr:hypothetical protein NEMBOFW57_010280 [Staphylotrichum longicolle]
MRPHVPISSKAGLNRPINASCVLGNIASYAINVSSAEDVAAGLRFAKQKNIRLSIKNTGHDFLGRLCWSGVAGTLDPQLKAISFRNYTSPQYKGPAIKLGAGVQAFEAYAAADKQGLRVTGGFCPTVGLAGGYVQGAGHGPLEGKYGLAADNTLEFEVVTGDGKYLVASPTKNSDLFWALNGGGGGTFAVVLSQTTRAHRDGIVAGAMAKVTVEAGQCPGSNTFWGVTDKIFTLYSGTLPDANASAIASLLDPFVQRLVELQLPHTYETNDSPTYYEHFSRYTPASRTRHGPCRGHAFRINGIASNVSHARVGNKPGRNSVNPAWRDALYWLNMDVYFDPTRLDVIGALQAQMNVNEGLFKALTPGGALSAFIDHLGYCP